MVFAVIRGIQIQARLSCGSEFSSADWPGVVAFTVGLVAEFCTFLPHDAMEWTLLTLGRFFSSSVLLNLRKHRTNEYEAAGAGQVCEMPLITLWLSQRSVTESTVAVARKATIAALGRGFQARS